MRKQDLVDALSRTRTQLADAITSASYNGKQHPDGQAAKNAAIRSSGPIQTLHKVFRDAIYSELNGRAVEHVSVWPPMGATSPELKVSGLLKSKNQDIAFTVDPHRAETIEVGVDMGKVDPVGWRATNNSLVIGVRSQLSSVEKNFDTLMERAFAETLNLRLRCPRITLGEIYLVPKFEFDDTSLKANRVGFRNRKVDVPKFLRMFESITDRRYYQDPLNIYKYNATALVVADFTGPNVDVLWTPEDFANVYPGEAITAAAELLAPSRFVNDIVSAYLDAIASKSSGA